MWVNSSTVLMSSPENLTRQYFRATLYILTLASYSQKQQHSNSLRIQPAEINSYPFLSTFVTRTYKENIYLFNNHVWIQLGSSNRTISLKKLTLKTPPETPNQRGIFSNQHTETFQLQVLPPPSQSRWGKQKYHLLKADSSNFAKVYFTQFYQTSCKHSRLS